MYYAAYFYGDNFDLHCTLVLICLPCYDNNVAELSLYDPGSFLGLLKY